MKRTVVGFLILLSVGLVTIYGLIAVVDPFDNLAFSPDLPRQRVSSNERLYFPGLIRHGDYDSAVFGTSTSMMLNPVALSKGFGQKFANLAMAGSTPWEQQRIIDLFLRHREKPSTLIIGLDIVWCNSDGPKLSFRDWPAWLYDEAPLNDYLHLLSEKMLFNSLRQLAAMAGVYKTPYGPDGFFPFLPDDKDYDIEKAKSQIYGNHTPVVTPLNETPFPVSRTSGLELTPTLNDAPYITQLVKNLPETDVYFFFVPYHASMMKTKSSWQRYERCKRDLVQAVEAFPNVAVIDYMIFSAITTKLENYWDRLHYRADIADILIADFVRLHKNRPLAHDFARVLKRR